jgi:glycosyltransferase involved in cell wall biosynthesis
MSACQRHITVCICTYRRPAWLKRLLEALQVQETSNLFDFSVVVADNDVSGSGEEVVLSFAARSHLKVIYCREPVRNIALVRNRAIKHAYGEFIAFIDDDEFPNRDWLAQLLHTCDQYNSAGVLGPVRPHFAETPPNWILEGRFCERAEQPTGTVMKWSVSRTGNVLFRRSILAGINDPFDPEFGTGAEDKDFFMRMNSRGHVFVWCNEAIAFETVPPSRWTRSYMLKRALLRGRNVLKHRTARTRLIMKSVIATPLYSLLLPLTLFCGHHVFMKYSIKLCDHVGRLLAVLGINPVREREM